MSTQIGFTPEPLRKWKFDLFGDAGMIEETIADDKRYLYLWRADLGVVTLEIMRSDIRLSNEVVEAKLRSSQTRIEIQAVEREVGFDELKRMPFMKIQVDGGHAVPFLTWRGVSPYAAGGPGEINLVLVRYFLNGNRLRIRRDVSHEEIWYTLS
jgi:hypothetical protein